MNPQASTQTQGTFFPYSEDEPNHHHGRKTARGDKLVRDRLKGKRERREDARIMKQAEYYAPFMEA